MKTQRQPAPAAPAVRAAAVVHISRKRTAHARRRCQRQRREPSRALFGAFLRAMRRDQSRATVTKSVGRSPGWLARYEHGQFLHPPTFEDLRALCSVLGINPVDLLLECGFIAEAEVVDAMFAIEQARHQAGGRRG